MRQRRALRTGCGGMTGFRASARCDLVSWFHALRWIPPVADAQFIGNGPAAMRGYALGLRITVAPSGGTAIVVGLMRILKGWPVPYLIVVGYVVIMIMAPFAPRVTVGIAYDSGASHHLHGDRTAGNRAGTGSLGDGSGKRSGAGRIGPDRLCQRVPHDDRDGIRATRAMDRTTRPPTGQEEWRVRSIAFSGRWASTTGSRDVRPRAPLAEDSKGACAVHPRPERSARFSLFPSMADRIFSGSPK
jgi:hypothetical protein